MTLTVLNVLKWFVSKLVKTSCAHNFVEYKKKLSYACFVGQLITRMTIPLWAVTNQLINMGGESSSNTSVYV